MSQSIRKLLAGCAAGICALSLVSALCLFFAFRTDYDTAIRHFITGTPYAAAAVFAVLSILLTAVVSAVLAAKKLSAAPRQGGSLSVFSAALFGFLLFAAFIFDMRSITNAWLTWPERIQPALGGLAS